MYIDTKHLNLPCPKKSCNGFCSEFIAVLIISGEKPFASVAGLAVAAADRESNGCQKTGLTQLGELSQEDGEWLR